MTTNTATDPTDDNVHLNAAPQALKPSGDSRLWAIKTNGVNRLFSIDDVLTELTMENPTPGHVRPVNPVTGVVGKITFRWSRPESFPATEYQLEIAQDRYFDSLLTTITVTSGQATINIEVGPDQSGAARLDFSSGQTYYWRVRVTGPLYGPYSRTQSFSVALVGGRIPTLLVPAIGGTGTSRTPAFSWEPVAGAEQYHFILADNVALASPIVDEIITSSAFAVTDELEYGQTYYWKVRPEFPVMGEWSALAHFTVKERPAEPPVPVVIQIPPMPAVPELPEPPLPPRFVSPPATTPIQETGVTPGYIWAIIVIGAILAAAVIYLIFRNLRLAAMQKDIAERLLREKSLSFAAESLLWMMSSEEQEDEFERILSTDEEEALGQKVASRIKKIVVDKVLYKEFPREASLFLSLWAHYGSREETDSYLTSTFWDKKRNVTDFLRCYLSVSREGLPSFTRKGSFGREEYEAVVKVVEPNHIYKVLQRWYGLDIEMGEGRGTGSPDRVLARQFVHIHRLVKGEQKEEQAED